MTPPKIERPAAKRRPYHREARATAVVAAPDAMSVEQAAATTNIGRTILYREIAAGRLKARKLGRKTLILAPDLRDFLDALPMREATRAGEARQ